MEGRGRAWERGEMRGGEERTVRVLEVVEGQYLCYVSAVSALSAVEEY